MMKPNKQSVMLIFVLLLCEVVAKWQESIDLPYVTSVDDKCNCDTLELKLKIEDKQKITVTFMGINSITTLIVDEDKGSYSHKFKHGSKGVTECAITAEKLQKRPDHTFVVAVDEDNFMRKLSINDKDICSPPGSEVSLEKIKTVKVEGNGKLMWIVNSKPKGNRDKTKITLEPQPSLRIFAVAQRLKKSNGDFRFSIAAEDDKIKEVLMFIEYRHDPLNKPTCSICTTYFNDTYNRNVDYCPVIATVEQIPAKSDISIAVEVSEKNTNNIYGSAEVWINGDPIGRMSQFQVIGRFVGQKALIFTTDLRTKFMGAWNCPGSCTQKALTAAPVNDPDID